MSSDAEPINPTGVDRKAPTIPPIEKMHQRVTDDVAIGRGMTSKEMEGDVMASSRRNRLVPYLSAAGIAVWSLAVMHAISTAQTADQSLADLVGLVDPTGGFDNASGALRTVSLD